MLTDDTETPVATDDAAPRVSFEIIACEWCGVDFKRVKGLRGRPRLFCCDECKDADARMRQAESAIAATIGRMSPERARALRSRLWRLANEAGNVAGRERGVEKVIRVRDEWKPALDCPSRGGTSREAAEAAGVDLDTLGTWRKHSAFREWLDEKRRKAARTTSEE